LTTHAQTSTNGTSPATSIDYAPASPPPAPASAPRTPERPPAARSAAAARRTSHRGVIVSVLVVLVGGLIAFAGAQMLTHHSQVLAVAANVPIGATVTDADLVVASVTADPNLSPIPASQRSQIVGMVAQVALVKGELLTRAQVGATSGFAAGQMLVALPLKQGQFPERGLTAGQKVLIVATPGTNGPATGSTTTGVGDGGSSAGAAGSSVAPTSGVAAGIDASVAEVGGMDQATQVTVIDVQVDADSAVAVAQLASTGNLALILLPAGG
jgi:hypothetical protein